MLARVSIFVARVPSLARKRAAILFRDFCDTEDYLDKSRCSRFTNSLSENKSSAAAIFYHYFVCKVTYYKPF